MNMQIIGGKPIEIDPVKHNYSQIKTSGKWKVQVSPTTGYGFYDHETQGEGGGLWFEGKELRDYDGRACLPRDVVVALRSLSYVVGSEF